MCLLALCFLDIFFDFFGTSLSMIVCMSGTAYLSNTSDCNTAGSHCLTVSIILVRRSSKDDGQE